MFGRAASRLFAGFGSLGGFFGGLLCHELEIFWQVVLAVWESFVKFGGMNKDITTLQQLLNGVTGLITIPVYQRAYSWRTSNVETLINDLQRQPTSFNYYYGHFQFEEVDGSILIIDGQQRLTTAFLLYLALRKLDKEKSRQFLNIFEKYESLKLETVDYDQRFFRERLYRQIGAIPENQSQTRLLENFNFLFNYFKNNVEELVSLITRVLGASVTYDVVTLKLQATQRFVLQNTRGVAPTDLDKIKSDLMFYVYMNEPDHKKAERYTTDIQKDFADIYRDLERINIVSDERTSLRYVVQAFFAIGDNTPVEAMRLMIANRNSLSFIQEVSSKLKIGFSKILLIEEISKDTNCLLGDALMIDKEKAMILFVRIGDYSDKNKIDDISRSFVRLYMRHNSYFPKKRSDYLLSLIRSYNNDINDFSQKLEVWARRGFTITERPFHMEFFLWLKVRNHYQWRSTNTRYILWKYENYLRSVNKIKRISYYDFANIESREVKYNFTIEHKIPQNPQSPHSDDFISLYLNCLGNLFIEYHGKNSSDGNQDAENKNRNTDIVSNSVEQVSAFYDSEGKFSEESIDKRNIELVNFAIKHFFYPDELASIIELHQSSQTRTT